MHKEDEQNIDELFLLRRPSRGCTEHSSKPSDKPEEPKPETTTEQG